nr:putative reverse transcriptase domain-containing protein [Tanacetum cinerariifolium]
KEGCASWERAQRHMGRSGQGVGTVSTYQSPPLPLPAPSSPLLLPATDPREDILEVDVPPRKRLCLIALASRFKVDVPPRKRLCLIALASRFEVGKSLAAAAARQPGLDVTHDTDYSFVDIVDATPGRPMPREIGYRITDVDVPPRKRLCLIALASRFEVGKSLAAAAARQPGLDVTHDTDYSFVDIVDATPGRPMPREIGYRITDAWPQAMECNKAVHAELLAYRAEAVGHNVAYEMKWKTLIKMLTEKYCPRGEIKKLEIKIWNLKVKGTDIVSYTQYFLELTLMCERMFPEESDQAGNGGATERAYALGNARKNPNANVVTDHDYDVKLADEKIIRVNTIIRGCTLNFLNHPFNIDLMPVELVSFDVIIGTDWLVKYHAVIIYDEKIVRITFGNEILIVRGDGSNNGHESRLNIHLVYQNSKVLAERMPLLFGTQDFPGIPPIRQVEFQIDLVPGAALLARAPYQLAASERKELSDQLHELSDKGFIRPSSSPWGAPVLLSRRKMDHSGCASFTEN